MKTFNKLLLIGCLSTVLSACSKEPLDFRNSEISNGALYVQNANEPFSGYVTNIPLAKIPLSSKQSKLLGNLIGTYARNSGDGEMGELIVASTLGGLLNGNDSLGVLCNIKVKKGIPEGAFKCYYNKELEFMTGDFSQGKLVKKLTMFRPVDQKSHEVMTADFDDGKLAGKLIIKSYLTNNVSYEEQHEENRIISKNFAPNKVLAMEMEVQDDKIVKQISYDPSSGALIGEALFNPQTKQVENGILASYRRKALTGEKYFNPESPIVVTEVSKYENGRTVGSLSFINEDFSMSKLVFPEAQTISNYPAASHSKTMNVPNELDSSRVLEGNCHMGSCTYSKILAKEVISNNETEVQVKATVLNGSKAFDGDYPTSIPTDIDWHESPEEVHAICSYDYPRIGSSELNSLDFSMISDVQIAEANLYFALCHNSYEGYTSGVGAFDYAS